MTTEKIQKNEGWRTDGRTFKGKALIVTWQADIGLKVITQSLTVFL